MILVILGPNEGYLATAARDALRPQPQLAFEATVTPEGV